MSEENVSPIDPSVTVESSQSVDVLPDGMTQLPDGSVQVLSTSAFKRLKEQAMQKGRKDHERAFNDKLKSLGYSSFDELVGALNASKSKQAAPSLDEELSFDDDFEDEVVEEQPQQQIRQKPQPTKAQNNMAKQSANAAQEDREKQRLRRQAEEARRRMVEESRRRKELQRSLEAKEAEMAIRETAMQCGVRDIDYAVSLLARNLDAKSEEELAAFDEKQFFSGLRNTHPYLFGEVARPATTGPGVGVQPAPLKPGTVAQATAQNAQVDARKMERQDFEAYLRSKGLSSPYSSIGEL